MSRVAFLGCSRGFGFAVLKEYCRIVPGTVGWALSRKIKDIEPWIAESHLSIGCWPCDFSNPGAVEELLTLLEAQAVDKLFYFAGGGPYGNYGDKDWKDHMWSWQVNFLTPARLIHWALGTGSSISQAVFVGSAIADALPDPGAASYSAGKHGLKGLVESLLAEGSPIDLRFFRPGYIDTSMLPKNSRPRLEGWPLLPPEKLATEFVEWTLDPLGIAIKTVNSPNDEASS